MRELAAEHGVPLADLVRTPLYGSTAPDAPFFAQFEWDMHHENPVTSADDLAQSTITRLYVHWGTASKAANLDGYARQVLVREFLGQRRTACRHAQCQAFDAHPGMRKGRAF